MIIYVPPQQPNASPDVDYYEKIIAPSLSGHFDSEFWSSLVLQLGQNDDAVRHAIAAICATHRAMEVSPPGANSLALQESNAAIRCLSTMISMESTPDVVPLVACILFACLEFMSGSVDSAMLHIFSGLKILNETSRDQAHTNSDIIEKLIVPVYSRLNILCMLFGHVLPPVHTTSEESSGSFSNHNSARRQLFDIMDRCLRFIKIASTKKQTFQIGFEDWVLQTKLLTELQTWRTNLEVFKIEARHGPKELLLRIHHRTVFIWLSACLSVEECALDPHINGFEEIVDLATGLTLTDEKLPRDIFSFEMRIIPPLYYTAIKCRDPDIRRRALNLLRFAAPREGLWNARIAMRVAERVIEIEEKEMGIAIPPSEVSRIHAVKELPAEFGHTMSYRPVPEIIEVIFITKPWGITGECSILNEEIIL
jgi:hypothetical protein